MRSFNCRVSWRGGYSHLIHKATPSPMQDVAWNSVCVPIADCSWAKPVYAALRQQLFVPTPILDSRRHR